MHFRLDLETQPPPFRHLSVPTRIFFIPTARFQRTPNFPRQRRSADRCRISEVEPTITDPFDDQLPDARQLRRLQAPFAHPPSARLLLQRPQPTGSIQRHPLTHRSKTHAEHVGRPRLPHASPHRLHHRAPQMRLRRDVTGGFVS